MTGAPDVPGADAPGADAPLADVPGAVLTGGASRRMGRTKALVDVDGVSMGRRVVDALRGAGCEPVALVGGHEDELAPIGVPVLSDRWPGEGPLGGVRTALAWARTVAPSAGVVVAACDLPALDAATVERLLVVAASRDADVVMARTERLEPALAWWSPSAAAVLGTAFERGERALHRSLGGLHVAEVEVDAAALRNVNTPGDLGRDEGHEGATR